MVPKHEGNKFTKSLLTSLQLRAAALFKDIWRGFWWYRTLVRSWENVRIYNSLYQGYSN